LESKFLEISEVGAGLVVARILRSKMIIIALARDPGRDRGTRLRVGPYFLSQNINQLNFQCNYSLFT
jgi:hypothetical protein